MSLAPLTDLQIEKTRFVVAVQKGGIHDGGHIGLAFHIAKTGVQLVHLAWHKKLCIDAVPRDLPPESPWLGEVVALPEVKSKHIVSFLAAAASRRPTSINYGVSVIGALGSFDERGSYNPPKNGNGLTCATFVTELLNKGGVQLLDILNWVPTEAGRLWAEEVLRRLQNTPGVEAAHLTTVQRAIGEAGEWVRVRPFEVAGVALRREPRQWPCSFEMAQEAADTLETELNLRFAVSEETACVEESSSVVLKAAGQEPSA